ncbi:MAG: transglutaminase domain-containing protein [bacterium]
MTYSPKKFHIRYRAVLKSSDNNIVKVWVAQPLNSITQKVESFSILPAPSKYYKDDKGNKILYFEFKNEKNINIEMNIKATIWKNKIDLKKENFLSPMYFAKSFQQYIKNEKFLEQTPALKKLTRKIINDDNPILDNVQSVFNFIVKNFRYCYPVKQRGVKHLDLTEPEGDCGEYSSLFVAMCRILKIPARNNTGFVIFPKQKKIAEHGWASAYFNSFGWLDFDTQYASLENGKKREKYFAQRRDYRIVFINGFNIFLKPVIPKNFQINYWNKLGLPLTNNSVQTLQPIVFASLKNIKFENNIELI